MNEPGIPTGDHDTTVREFIKQVKASPGVWFKCHPAIGSLRGERGKSIFVDPAMFELYKDAWGSQLWIRKRRKPSDLPEAPGYFNG